MRLSEVPSSRLAIYVLAACCAVAPASAQSNAGTPSTPVPADPASLGESTPDTYDSWITGYKTGPLSGSLGDKHRIVLAVSIVDDDSTPNPETSRFFINNDVITTLALSTDGTVSMVRVTPMAIQGGGPGRIPKDDFKRLKVLMKQLPDDYSYLPPKGRRLVVRADTGRGIQARVYDRANLPDTVVEIADLVGADTWPLYKFPEFQPDARFQDILHPAPRTPSEVPNLSQPDHRTLAVSPDQRLRVVEINPALWWDTTVHVEDLKTSREAPYDTRFWSTLRIEDHQSGALIHEFREPMIGRRSIHIYAAQFTPDGRFLIALSAIPNMRIYDTTTWQPVDSMPGVPAGAVAYDPSPDWKHGVAVFPSGEVSLIEAGSGRKLAEIDPGNDLQSVVYSPDGSRVAIVTERSDPQNGYSCHMRIWETATGRLLRELRPLEGTPRDTFGTPIWWPDGKYLFALTRESHYAGSWVIGIWNTESGRYRGGLAGCIYPADPGTRVIAKNGDFYMNCRDDLLMWKGDDAIEKIVGFEKSLPQ